MWLILSWTAFAGSADWELAPTTWVVEEPVELVRPLSTWRLEHGFVFQVVEDAEPVGLAFVGEGSWKVSFSSSTDAVVTANRLAVIEGVVPGELAGVARGEDLDLFVDRGLILSMEAWETLGGSLLEVRTGGRAVFGRHQGVEEVVVTARKPGQARRIARRTLEDRTEWMRLHHFDPASLLTVDRWDAAGDPIWLVDMRTDQSWDRFAGHQTLGPNNHWLAYVQDPSGAFDPQAGAVVLARDVTDEGVLLRHDVSRARFPADAGGIRAPRRSVDLRAARASHAFLPLDGGMSLVSESVVDLDVTAHGGETSVVWVDIPHVEQRSWVSNPPLANGWSLDGFSTPSGEPIEAVHLPLTGDQREGRGGPRTYAVRLPTPLEEGSDTVVRVQWRDRHRYAHVLSLESNDPKNLLTAAYSMGQATDLLPALPRVRTNRTSRVRVTVRAAVPQWLGARHRPVISGSGERVWEEGGWRWVEVVSSSPRPSLAVGRWDVHQDAAARDMPAVLAALRTGGASQMPRQVRQLINLYQTVLPPYPASRVEVAELVAPLERLGIFVGGDGMVGFATTKERAKMLGGESAARRRYPHLEMFGLAAALHAHWWVDLGVRGVDQSLPVVFGTAYGIATVEAAHGDAAHAWWDLMRRCAAPEDGRIDPLTSSSGRSWCTGAALVGGVLAEVVGRPGVLEAVDRVVRGEYPPSYEGLQASLEAVSGRDLDDVFDLWVYSGLAPAVKVSWRHEDGRIRGEVSSDVPFGSLEVPVRVVARGVEVQGIAVVHDGEGSFSVDWPHAEAPTRFEVDPREALLLRSVRVARL